MEGKAQTFRWGNPWQWKEPPELSQKSQSEEEPYHSSGFKSGFLWVGAFCWLTANSWVGKAYLHRSLENLHFWNQLFMDFRRGRAVGRAKRVKMPATVKQCSPLSLLQVFFLGSLCIKGLCFWPQWSDRNQFLPPDWNNQNTEYMKQWFSRPWTSGSERRWPMRDGKKRK